jgi:protein SCO1/2
MALRPSAPRRPGRPVRAWSLVALVVALLTAACGSERPLQAASPPQPYRVPAVTLTSTGGPYDLRARTAGRDVLLYFGYTHCDDECPAAMSTVATALRDSPADVARRTTVLFVTSDPHRDSAAVLRTWLARFPWPTGADVVGLTGSLDTIARAASSVDVPLIAEDQGAHGTDILGFDRSGVAKAVWTQGVRPAEITHDLPQLEAAPAPEAVAPPFVAALDLGSLEIGNTTVSGTTATLVLRNTGAADALLAVRPGTVDLPVDLPAGKDTTVHVTLPPPAHTPGQVVPLALQFRRAGAITVQVPVVG